MARVGLHNGAPGKEFRLQPRPRLVRVELRDGSRLVSWTELELADRPDFQTFEVSARGARQARVRVLSVHAGQRGDDAALTEVQFSAKQ